MTQPQPAKCQYCGHIGNDVIHRFQHVGGQGEVLVTQCFDEEKCWKMIDKNLEYEVLNAIQDNP